MQGSPHSKNNHVSMPPLIHMSTPST